MGIIKSFDLKQATTWSLALSLPNLLQEQSHISILIFRSHKMSVFRMLFFICLVGTIYGKSLNSDLGTAEMDDTKEFGNKEMSREMDFGLDSATFSSDAKWCPIGPGLCKG